MAKTPAFCHLTERELKEFELKKQHVFSKFHLEFEISLICLISATVAEMRLQSRKKWDLRFGPTFRQTLYQISPVHKVQIF